jgi:hypothetical protein
LRNRLPGIKLRPAISRQLAIALLLLHMAAAIAILLDPVSTNIKLMLLLLLLIHGFWSHRYFLTRHAGRIVQAQLDGDGNGLLHWRDGRQCKAILRADTLLTSWIIVLRFDLQQRRFPVSLLLCPDAITRAENRRLRTLLRFVLLEPANRA